MLPLLLLLTHAACPPDRGVLGEPARWARALRAATPEQDNALLAGLRLPPLEDPANAVTVQVVRADGPGGEVLLVADFTLDPATHAYRVQVLRPAGAGAWCALGDEPGLTVALARRSPCPAGDDTPDTFESVRFRFRMVDDARHPAVERIWTTRQSSCRGMSGERSVHELWSTKGDALRPLLTLSEGSYTMAMGMGTVHEWFALQGPVPVTVTQHVEFKDCSEPDACVDSVRTLRPPGYQAAAGDAGVPPTSP